MSAESTGNGQLSEEEVRAMIDVGQGKVVEATHPTGIPMAEWCFTNDKENPFIRQQFHTLMDACFANMIGMMNAKNKETGETQILIVGVENREEDGVVTYPLARILTLEEQNLYLAPDGNGGWLGEDDE